MPSLVYNCPSGISGDMNLAAMVALGVDIQTLETELKKLPYSGWSLRFEKAARNGIEGLLCKVELKHSHPEDEHHSQQQHHEHTHAHKHSHATHSNRTYSEIKATIQGSTLKTKVKDDAIACFLALAEAEAAVHGIPIESVHFHEVGAIDSIIDIVGAAICWDLLKIDRIFCTHLEVGGGTVQCAHGTMPVPAPATARLLKGIPYSFGATNKETTTPTGATLLVGKKCAFHPKQSGTLIESAIAIGEREDPNLANALFVSLVEEAILESDSVLELVTNIDDMSAEAISYLCEQLLEAGALDVWQRSATFKKGRLGSTVHALCPLPIKSQVENAFFKHSRTLGLRFREWERSKLKRVIQTLQTPHGTVRVKTAHLPDDSVRYKFEYDDCARIAKKENQSIEWVENELEKQMEPDS